MFIILIIVILIILTYSTKINEYFLDNNANNTSKLKNQYPLIKKQQCFTLIRSFPTLLKCNYFKDIYNKKDIVKLGINEKNPLILLTKKNNLHKLEVNTYKIDPLYLKETQSCKEIIEWMMNYCRFKL